MNYTSHTYTAPGTFVVRVTVIDPYGRTAQANVTVLVTVQPLSSSGFTLLDGAVVGLVIVIIVAAFLLARRRPPTGNPPASAPVPSTGAISGEGEGAIPLPPSDSDTPRPSTRGPPGGPSNPEETP